MDPLSYHLLNGSQWMDKLGADEWNLHVVATAVSESSLDNKSIFNLFVTSHNWQVPLQSAVFFLGVRAAFGEKYGVKWDSFLHASITGIGSLVAIYLSVYASSALTGYEGKNIWKIFSSLYKKTFPTIWLLIDLI